MHGKIQFLRKYPHTSLQKIPADIPTENSCGHPYRKFLWTSQQKIPVDIPTENSCGFITLSIL